MMTQTQASAHDAPDLERRIVSFLRQRGFASLPQLDIHVDQGTVTLQGTVSTFYERQLCIHCCQRVAGVVRLVDQLSVRWCGSTMAQGNEGTDGTSGTDGRD